MVFSAELENDGCDTPFSVEEKQSLTISDKICVP
jgi:hypothetical protein